jgi:hypothetical protein
MTTLRYFQQKLKINLDGENFAIPGAESFMEPSTT